MDTERVSEINKAQFELMESFFSSTGSSIEIIQEDVDTDIGTKVLYMKRALILIPEDFLKSLNKLYDRKKDNIETIRALKLINDLYFNVNVLF